MGRPDAVLVPIHLAVGPNANERMASVAAIAEKLLECGPLELAWCHSQITYFFCTRDPEDTELYGDWHQQARRPKYRWETRPDGTKLGYLMSGAE